MNLYNFLNIKNPSNLDIVKASLVKEKLNLFLSPHLIELGLINWDKNYRWSSDFNQYGVKHILEYVNLKGVSGTFQYGNTFSFIPLVNEKGKLIKNNNQLQLIEKTKGWHESFESEDGVKDYRVSHWNEYFFNKSLPKIFNGEKKQIVEWYKSNENIEQNIKTVLKQIESGGSYHLNSPHQKLILSFLYAKNGELNLAKSTLYEYFKSLIAVNQEIKSEFELYEKLIEKLD